MVRSSSPRIYKKHIRLSGGTQGRITLYWPQSTGKLERFNRAINHECIRPNTPVSLDDALRIVTEFVTFYNNKRLHSAVGYIAPVDKLNGKAEEIFNARDRKLEAARAERKLQRQALMPTAVAFNNCSVTNLEVAA